jgi:hypothetical protein
MEKSRIGMGITSIKSDYLLDGHATGVVEALP